MRLLNGIAADDPDVGRSEITSKPTDLGKFKTPTLRNVAVTAPYMHDGSLATLEDVVAQYDAGGRGHENTDPLIRPLGLTDDEKADLVAFLGALTDDAFLTNPDFADPELELLRTKTPRASPSHRQLGARPGAS